MMPMIDWLMNLFTLQGLFHFMSGVGAAAMWHLSKAYFRRQVVIFKWQYIAAPLVIGITLYMANQTQTNADCVREFQQVLRDRSSVTSENDKLSQEQRQLIYGWIHNLVFPPPDIAKLDGTDPARERWAVDLTLETDKKFRASLDEQRDNDEYRAAHPLPPATCGL